MKRKPAKTTYRLYDRDSLGRVLSVIEIECATDAQAYGSAEQQAKPGRCAELWCGPRFVCHIQPLVPVREVANRQKFMEA